MIDYKKIFKVITLFAALLMPMLASAVTQKEMEQARTIAAKAYLRYANDGSGYLDDINPTTMEELEAALKPKEKENIKAFKSIPVPSDYKDWGKEKLVEYWAVTAFQNKGLLEKGLGGRIRARSQINKMTVAPASDQQASSKTPAAVAEQDSATATPAAVAADSLAAVPAVALDEMAAEQDYNVDKATNYTWVYIMVLCILVAIVIALMVYASNVLKKNGGRSVHDNDPDGDHEKLEETRERYESTISDKDVEIAMLNKKLEAARRQNSELKEKVESLTAQLAALSAGRQEKSASMKTENAAVSHPVQPKPTVRSIFLGRANSKGIFVRADRSLNVGNSVFSLDTSDGYSGSFRVADSPAAWSLALSNPREYLETACTGYDLEDTDGASRIITETSGTAVFEGGCWRVIRKARIRYE